MRKYFVTISLLACFITSKSQTIGYNYDLHGNRIQRVLGVSSTNRIAHNDSVHTYDIPTMELAMEYGISVFPNPTATNVNVVSNKIPEDGSATIYLYDNLGRLLKKITKAKPQEEIILLDYVAGIYIIAIIVSEKDKLYYKVIKE